MNRFSIIILYFLIITSNTFAVTYYINTTGSNGDGLTIATAWTSVANVNTSTLNPGDSVLFEGGETFDGYIEIDNTDGNNASNPIVFSSYGNGKATLQTTGTTKCGFKATNTQGILIANLIFIGPGVGLASSKDGILFYTNNPSGYLSNINVQNVEVSGFGFCGIRCYSEWSANVNAGFRRVRIDNCIVHDCRENGIVSIGYDTQSSTSYQHYNMRVTNCKVYDITGYAANAHKGSGIVLSQVDSALIERCEVFNTGTQNTACGGPGGIWVYAANNVNIQLCESHHNSSGTGSGCDGLGFDLDGGVTNSVLQYCYSHDNDGAGILLGNFWGARPWGNNVVRYNISINDARTNNSPVTLFTSPNTAWNGLKFYNNTIYVSPSATNNTSTFSAFQMTEYGSSMAGVECYNNIFQTTGNLPLINIPTTFAAENPKFLGNLYWTSGGTFSILYGTSCNSLAAFRTAGMNCEHIVNTNTGIEGNPLLSNIQQAAPILFPLINDSLKIAQIAANSPAKDAGLNLSSQFGINIGNRDFWNTSLPIGSGYDIGANEFNENASSQIDNLLLAKSIKLFPNPTKEDITIELELSDGELYALTITNPLGQEVYKQTLPFSGKVKTRLILPINDWTSGIYSFLIRGNSTHYIGKFVVFK